MARRDIIVDFLESCNFKTRKPTQEFIKLKEEYDTQVKPRRKTLKELRLLEEEDQTLINAVIEKEREFSYKILLAGEAQEYFFSESLELQNSSFWTEVNMKAGILCPFDYSAKISELPSEFQKAISEHLQYHELDWMTAEMVNKIGKFYDFAVRVCYRRDGFEKLRLDIPLPLLVRHANLYFCKINTVVIAYYTIGEYIYFRYN